jgi:hypothetical protein
LTSHAIATEPDTAGSAPPARKDGTGMKIARNVDLIFLALALIVFVAAGLPILGWVTGAGAWIGQRLVRDFLNARARKAEDPREMVGYLAGSMIGRGWIVALIIFGVGLATEDAVGLSAAVLFVFTFTFYLTVSMITRPFEDGAGV